MGDGGDGRRGSKNVKHTVGDDESTSIGTVDGGSAGTHTRIHQATIRDATKRL